MENAKWLVEELAEWNFTNSQIDKVLFLIQELGFLEAEDALDFEEWADAKREETDRGEK